MQRLSTRGYQQPWVIGFSLTNWPYTSAQRGLGQIYNEQLAPYHVSYTSNARFARCI